MKPFVLASPVHLKGFDRMFISEEGFPFTQAEKELAEAVRKFRAMERAALLNEIAHLEAKVERHMPERPRIDVTAWDALAKLRSEIDALHANPAASREEIAAKEREHHLLRESLAASPRQTVVYQESES